MDAERNYLSYGGGVNSTALMLLLIEKAIEFECVFADHGGDYPETYEYVKMLQNKGYPITTLQTRRDGLTLYDYCIKYGRLPSPRHRWCTHHWKIIPLSHYHQKPCYVMIGIDAGEAHRAHRGEDTEGEIRDYPLIEWNIDRHGCEGIIKRHGLPIPRRSGCFFCPFMTRGALRQLRYRQDLWCKLLELENSAVERRIQRGKKPYYLFKHPLEIMVNENQPNMFEERQPCVCRT